MTATLEDLLRDNPSIHGDAASGDLMTHGLVEEALAHLSATVRPGDRTLETGSGFSTIVFALAGAQHTAIMPFQNEVDRILAYCTAERHPDGRADVPRRALRARCLPAPRPAAPWTDVLIDGSHSFPQVFIDWFYVAAPMRVGGQLLVDDVHLWTGKVLRDFLVAEPEWEKLDELGGRTTIFRKVAEVDPDKHWLKQPYVVRRTHSARSAWRAWRCRWCATATAPSCPGAPGTSFASVSAGSPA